MDSHPHAPLPPPSAAPQLRCVLLCDLVASTRLVEVLGDIRAAELIREHDRLARELLQRHRGQEIDKTDGFLLLFERPIEAVRFALDYQRSLRALGERVGQTLRARVGVHVGEVLSWRNDAAAVAAGAKPVEVEGLAKAIAARLMALADPGQVLLSESAYSLALRARDELSDLGDVRWAEHGRYRLQGVARPLPVYEVGEAGPAPLAAPANKPKARRILPWYRWKPLYLLLALALVAAPIWYALKPTPAIAFAERDWIVVADVRNLTGDLRFDDSLDTAIRYGLEQSRHVNLVAQLRTREALAMMQRPKETRLDREVGAELAQRVGARALLLPTLAEVGGRIRFTAELVDPRTGSTVYSEFDESGDESGVLPAVDTVLQRVRGNLGESLSAVEAASLPLAQITTGNLDALRAFSLGRQAVNESRLEDAELLYRQALELDPHCDAATLGLAAIALTREDERLAHELLGRVELERLRVRDKLYVEAMRAQLEQPLEEAARRWRLFTQVYPDEFRAQANLGHVLFAQREYAAALAAMRATLQPQNPLLGASYSSVATMAMAGSDFVQAREAQQKALEHGNTGRFTNFALLPLLMGDLAAARQVVAGWGQVTEASSARRVALVGSVIELSQGRWRDGRERLRSANLSAEAIRDSDEWRLLQRVLDLALDGIDPQRAQLTEQIEATGTRLGEGVLSERRDAGLQLLQLGVLAARAGAGDLAARALALFDAQPALAREPLLAQLATAARAEAALAAGRADEALQQIAAAAEDQDLFQLQATRLRVAVAVGDAALAERSWQWMQAHRGRAFSEARLNAPMLAMNQLEASSAVLRLARLAGDAAGAELATEVARLRALQAEGQLSPADATAQPPAQAGG